MATLCNYTHYELQNTSGLERQGHGVRFPYNPEFYDRASGLYGPGSIIAWNMLFVSLVINVVYQERPDKTPDRPNFWSGMSAELVTFVAYPVFAATELLVRGVNLIGHQDRASALFCLRDQISFRLQGSGNGKSPQHPLDLANIPPNILSLGQRIVEMTGPLEVCYSYFPLLAFWVTINVSARRPYRSAVTVVLGPGTAYVVLLVFSFHCTLGSFLTGLVLIPSIEGLRLLWRLIAVICIYADTVLAGRAILFLGDWLWTGCLRLRGDQERMAALAPVRQNKKPKDMADFPYGVLVFGGMSYLWIGFLRPGSAWVPDLDVALSEPDQLAAVIAASLSLCYTIYGAVRREHMHPGMEVGDTVELRDSLLPELDSQDEEAPVGSRRINTM